MIEKKDLTHTFKTTCHNIIDLFKNTNKLSTFMRKLEQQSLIDPDRYTINNYLGDGFEFLMEIFIKTHAYDNRIGITEYAPVKSNEDTGVDGIGINIDGEKCVIQHKYRANNTTLLTANEDHLSNVIIKTCNILGYFPSYLVVYNENNNKNEFHFDKQYLNNKYKKIIIRFEAKYSDGLYSNDIIVPEYLYHLSPTKKIKKILEYGLEPKSNNRKTKYSERIYFFKDKTNYQDLLNNLKLNDKINNLNDNYTLLKVKTNKKTIYHTAPNYINGVYTYDNIHPKNITIELENS